MAERDYRQRMIVTGGAGFIGSNLLLLLVPRRTDCLFVNVDCLTYAGNLANLREIENLPNYRFERIDIRDFESLSGCFEKYEPTGVMHLAAESHVDRSIIGPAPFVQTNVTGTFNLLELTRAAAQQRGREAIRFLHVSTDEVFGSLGEQGTFSEETPYRPNSPYSASKASADHLARAYHRTYGLDVVTTNCSNNYGPYQFPEKLIPLMIRNARAERPLPVYGDGGHVRDWLYVGDHCEALDLVFRNGNAGETYNIGARCEMRNIDLVRMICQIMDQKLGGGPREDLIVFIPDRQGHDRRYAIDPSRIEFELGWKPRVPPENGLTDTVQWYLDNRDWVEQCISGEYLKYYEEVYERRRA